LTRIGARRRCRGVTAGPGPAAGPRTGPAAGPRNRPGSTPAARSRPRIGPTDGTGPRTRVRHSRTSASTGAADRPGKHGCGKGLLRGAGGVGIVWRTRVGSLSHRLGTTLRARLAGMNAVTSQPLGVLVNQRTPAQDVKVAVVRCEIGEDRVEVARRVTVRRWAHDVGPDDAPIRTKFVEESGRVATEIVGAQIVGAGRHDDDPGNFGACGHRSKRRERAVRPAPDLGLVGHISIGE